MRKTAIILVLIVWASTASSSPRRRRFPCKTPDIATTCYWTHGRLHGYMGSPSLRLLKTGTHRVLGIYDGLKHGQIDYDSNERPELPVGLDALKMAETNAWGDFEVCPLEPPKPHTMQAACIESFKNLYIEDLTKEH